MLRDLMYQDRVNRDYGITVPYEAPQAPTPAPQAPQPLPATEPLPAVEDLPAIHRPSNLALRETQLQDVTCPHCGMIFTP
jgi:hypothetical protein